MYSTVSDVKIFAGIVGNYDITTASILSKISMADSIINGKIFDVYTLPLTEVPGLILNLSAELAASFVLADEYGVETDGTDKNWEIRQEKVLELLSEIQTRKLKLVSDTTGLELALASRTQPSFLANDVTEVAQDSTNTESKFGMQQIF